jgi:hypothetical protein
MLWAHRCKYWAMYAREVGEFQGIVRGCVAMDDEYGLPFGR